MIRENSLLVKTNRGLAKYLLNSSFLLISNIALLIGAGEALIALYRLAGSLRPFVFFGVVHYVSILKPEYGIYASFPRWIFVTCHNRGSSLIKYVTSYCDCGKEQGLPDVSDASVKHRGNHSILEIAIFSLAIISGTGKTKGLFNYGCDYQSFYGSVS